jgi:hypothetical protein
METSIYSFELYELEAGNWSLVLLKNGRVSGGFVGSDFADLQTAGNNWVASHAYESDLC